MSELSELPSVLVGVSGEYFVAAELSRRGYVASITLRNTRSIDVIATNSNASRSVGISVKTNRGSKKDWMLNHKAEKDYSPTMFYVFVNLRESLEERPDYHVVPSTLVAKFAEESHKAWLATPGRNGVRHRDTSVRHFKDPDCKYMDQWHLLGLDEQ